VPRKAVDKNRLKKLAQNSYESSIDAYIEKNLDYIDEDSTPLIVQLYHLAATLDGKAQGNRQTSGTITQEWRMSFNALQKLVSDERERQEAAKLAEELANMVDPDTEALGDFV
jgi:DNA topoisomerase VI subunit B